MTRVLFLKGMVTFTNVKRKKNSWNAQREMQTGAISIIAFDL